LNRESYINEIKLALTGFVLDSEIDDVVYNRILDSAFLKVQRYINTTTLITLPYTNCIDLQALNVDVVKNVYRTSGYGYEAAQGEEMTMGDPVYFQYWAWLGGGSTEGINNYAHNLGAYNQLLQIRNTTTTDLAWKQDKSQNKLYINVSGNVPDKITIEYIPMYKDIQDVTSNYWIDVLVRMSVAIAKITVGRIRTRYSQAGALWQQDGETILNEGNTELKELQDYLQTNHDLFVAMD